MAYSRDHPLAKGSSGVETAPRNPPTSHSAAFIVGTLGLAAFSYFASGYVNNIVTPLLVPLAREIHVHPARTDPVVNLGYASYRGLLNESVPNVVSWLGVPYALPPRRFRAPQALDETPREHEIQDTQEYPPFCVQGWSPWKGCG
jgi:hypothetical protein